jgi:NTP pyrophosphatase (non-canonical NTP hydrolase)
MNSKEYVDQAISTESRPAHIAFGTVGLHAVLSLAVVTSKLLDRAKRKIYYGTPLNQEEVAAMLQQIAGTANFLFSHNQAGQLDNPLDADSLPSDAQVPVGILRAKLSNLNPRLLHAGVGLFTESGEALEALLIALETGKFDPVNFAEELGDMQWYTAVGVDAAGADLDDIRAKNIAKLRARFPEKFSAYDAQHENRDLAKERAVLEGDVIDVAPAANDETKAA